MAYQRFPMPVSHLSHWSEKYNDPQVVTTFSGGRQQSHRKFTRGRRYFAVGWNALTYAQYTALVAFMAATQGTIFEFEHPITGTIYLVRWGIDELPESSQVTKIDGVVYVSLGPIVLVED